MSLLLTANKPNNSCGLSFISRPRTHLLYPSHCDSHYFSSMLKVLEGIGATAPLISSPSWQLLPVALATPFARRYLPAKPTTMEIDVRLPLRKSCCLRLARRPREAGGSRYAKA